MRKYIGAILMLAVLGAVAAGIIIYMDDHMDEGYNLDIKVDLLADYIGCHRADIISWGGGYDDSDGMYRYEFIWIPHRGSKIMITYEADVDLTVDTLDLLIGTPMD